ncbi:sporulation protein [Chryseomicrobium sp. FSL W7-1435]|uniref:sporulation protein n=1 Tax=Chryseomicrobium sp. FSL W7-1435 TaxID=2921704 RepID=UPI00315AE404
MSLFNKMLASIGVGSAKVDTVLSKAVYRAGEQMEGVIKISGGKSEQQIDAIYLAVYTTYIRELDDRKFTDKAVVHKQKVVDHFTLAANEQKEIPFSFVVPFDTPVTKGATRVWIQTMLDIASAVDPTDKDYIQVEPTVLAATVLKEIENLGFRLRKADCQQASRKYKGMYPFMQEFEYVPMTGEFYGKLDEIEVVFLSQTPDKAELLLQIDRKARGFGGFLAEAMDQDETFVPLTIHKHEVSDIKSKLYQVLRKYS